MALSILRPKFTGRKPVRALHTAGAGDTLAPAASRVDFYLLFTMLAMLLIGLIFLYSSSAFWAEQYLHDPLYFFKRQLMFVAAGALGAMFLIKNYHKVRKINPTYILGFTWILLLIARFSPTTANVHRWIKIGTIQIQPSEFAKIALIIYLGDYFDRHKSKLDKTPSVLINPFAMTGITLLLIGLGKDLGTPVLMFGVVIILMFAAGVRMRYLFAAAAASAPVLIFELFRYSYRLKRLLVYLSPEANPSGDGYQLTRSFLAIGSGGWLGTGMGASKMKLLYLPAPHTDFIFSVMAEELGLIWTLGIIGMFCFLLVRGIKVALRAEPFSNSLVALGITLTLVFQAFFNMAMVVGLIPTKGLPLPFFSYGGSSILATMLMAGILLHISTRRAVQHQPLYGKPIL